jgi:hypothetical protein
MLSSVRRSGVHGQPRALPLAWAHMALSMDPGAGGACGDPACTDPAHSHLQAHEHAALSAELGAGGGGSAAIRCAPTPPTTTHTGTTASKEWAKEEALVAAKSRIACLRGLLGGGNDGKELLCLISRGCGHEQCQSLNQSRAFGWQVSRGVPHAVVDGTDPNAHNLQERLFTISCTRGGYPQFLLVSLMLSLGNGGGSGNGNGGRRDIIKYFGNFDRMKMLNKTSSLLPKVLVMHPNLMTWEDIHFGMTATPPPHRRHDRRPPRQQRCQGGRRRSCSRTRPDGGTGIH